MANKVLVDRDMVMKIMDETSGTPKSQIVQFRGNFKGPMGRPRPEETLMISAGVADSTIHHRVLTDRVTFESRPKVEISGKIYDNTTTTSLFDFLSNPLDEATWNALTTALTGVTTLGSAINADGSSVTLPMPEDAHRAAHLTALEVLWDADTTDWGLRYAGIFWEAGDTGLDTAAEEEGSFSASGSCFGGITKITAFTASTAVT